MSQIVEVVQRLGAEGKGLLAADERPTTFEGRAKSVGIANTEEKRRDFRGAMFTAPDLGRYVSGIIMHGETFGQRYDGRSFVDILEAQGIAPILKIDGGTKDFLGIPGGEKDIRDMDGLEGRIIKGADMGAVAGKLRSVIAIVDGGPPSDANLYANAHQQSESAVLCLNNGLVPIIEPEVEVRSDGVQTLETTYQVTRDILQIVTETLEMYGVDLNSVVFKPNFVIPGKAYHDKHSHGKLIKDIARLTNAAIQYPASRGVNVFTWLSGGYEHAQECLDAVNRFNDDSVQPQADGPVRRTFSFGRDLQSKPLYEFSRNGMGVVGRVHDAILEMAQLASLASQGKLPDPAYLR